nr:reverse transcriptase domain-containing protein [Tanacetum cinerariifolium]
MQTRSSSRLAPTEGYEDAIVIPTITADNFELKHGLFTLVQNKQFFGHDKEDPHAHVRYFNKITSTLKFPNILNTSIKLILFPFSLEGVAQIWLKKEPPRSFFTWDDLVSKFINQFFPPSKIINLRNEITNFQQRFDESFSEAWDRFKDLLRACPHHATDSNVYRDNIQEFFSKASAVNYNQGNTSYRSPTMSNQIQPPGFPPVPNNQNAQRNNQNRFIPNQNWGNNFNQGPVYQPSVVEDGPEVTKDPVNPTNNGNTEDIKPQVVQSESPVLTSKPVTSSISEPAIASIFKDMSFEISFADALILMPKFASTLKALIGNKEKLSEMAQTPLNEHCSAVLLKKLPEKLGDPGKFLIPCDFPGMAECLALADLGASINLMPFFVWKRVSLPDLTPKCMTLELVDRSISHLVGVAEDVYFNVGSFHFPADFVVVDFDADPRVPLILERSFLKIKRALIDVFEGELNLRVGKEAITFNLDQTS